MKKLIFCLASAFALCACTGGSSDKAASGAEDNDSVLGVCDYDGSLDYVKRAATEIYTEVTVGKERRQGEQGVAFQGFPGQGEEGS